MTTILVTGADGFIGRSLGPALQKPGRRIVGQALTGGPLPGYDEVHTGLLLDPLPEGIKKAEIDVSIHLAHDFGRDALRANVDGTRLWAEELARAGVKRQIFFSSLSAREDSPSLYGRAKFELENWFRDREDIVLQPGLVIGDGGLFRRLADMVRKGLVLPLPGRGRTRVHLVGMDMLIGIIDDIVQGKFDPPGGMVWRLYQPEAVTLRELLAEIRRQTGARSLFLPVPAGILLLAASVSERLPFLRLGVSRDNVLGLRRNEVPAGPSDLAFFGRASLLLPDLVRSALSPLRQD